MGCKYTEVKHSRAVGLFYYILNILYTEGHYLTVFETHIANITPYLAQETDDHALNHHA